MMILPRLCAGFMLASAAAQAQESSFAVAPELSYVIEPFEVSDLIDIATEGDEDLSLVLTEPRFGDNALKIDFEVNKTKEFGFEAGEGGDARFSCKGATSVSLWYKVVVRDDPAGEVLGTAEKFSVQLSFTEDINATEAFLSSEFLVSVSANEDWKKLTFDINDESSSVLEEFYTWEIAVDASNSTSLAALLLDHMSCTGDGNMFGNLVALNAAAGIIHFESELSENRTTITAANGILDMNYTVEQREEWGGFVAVSFSAPGNAYYNFSGSKDLSFDYQVLTAASPDDRVHLRVEIADSSNCTSDCGDIASNEVYYSFHQILDSRGDDSFVIPLQGDNQPGSPLERTGWTGTVGNNVFDLEHVKGVIFEISINDKGAIGSLAAGHLEIGNVKLGAATIPQDQAKNMVADNSVVFRPAGTPEEAGNYRRVQFAAGQCESLCVADDACLYAYFEGRIDCFLYTSLKPENVALSNTEFINDFSYWKSGEVARGDFCERCDCFESIGLIDCRGKNLLTIPETVSIQDWHPTALDLRGNDALLFLGENALNNTALAELEELRLPHRLIHFAKSNTDGKESLHSIVIDQSENSRNFITGSGEMFSDVCCSPGDFFALDDPSTGVAFCEMGADHRGADTSYLPFINIFGGFRMATIKESSDFMSDAAASPENCAEYCALSSECMYFTHDARIGEAENSCLLLFNNGTEPPTRVCCDEGDYADTDQEVPGFVSGLPSRTRHTVENAKVIVASSTIQLQPSSDYRSVIIYSLGAEPQRGAVWIEPYLPLLADFDITFSPSKVVLYDNTTTASIEVHLSGIDQMAESGTFLIQSIITSCDEAFSGRELDQGETDVVAAITLPETMSGSNNAIIIVASVMSVVAALFAMVGYVIFDRRKRQNDDLWIVKPSEIEFCDPPRIVGRGTFGLVILANFRGTQVAVKRVIPPQRKKSHTGSGYDSADDFTSSHDPELGGVVASGQLSPAEGKRSGRKGRYSQLKSDFISEMRLLSKLRHPCITTVMGAVIESDEPMLIMEYMDHGSLFDVLHNETIVLDGDILLPILKDIAQGMRFLHAATPKVIHGDLKAQNILVDSRFRAKVADFGLSQKKQLGATGTPYWMAPELLLGQETNNATTDVYAFGMILYEVFSRKEPYEGEDHQEVLSRVADPLVNKRPATPPGCPARASRMMEVCLTAEATYRPTFEVIDEDLKTLDAKVMQPTNNRRKMLRRSGSSDAIGSSTVDFLDEIFPSHVADALRDGRKVEPESKDCVTILFSDLKGFTEISSKLSALKVSDMLDRLYAGLDALSREHNVFKVETIGDAYMAVTNLVEEQKDHARRMVEFGIQAAQVARNTLIDTEKPDLGYLTMRIGIHSGPVVANVVGSRNPRYCLFGDSVNTASRMESSGEAGRIQCSEETAQLLQHQASDTHVISTIARGPIEVKGKGLMNTFWVKQSLV